MKVPTGDQEKYAGVCIKQFQRETDHGDIVEFLCMSGLPEENKESIVIKPNGIVNIRNLDNATSKILIEAIHGKVSLGRKLYCNGIIPLTPEKKDAVAEDVLTTAPPSASPPKPTGTSAANAVTGEQESDSLKTAAAAPPGGSPPKPTGTCDTNADQAANFQTPRTDLKDVSISNIELMRRHSLSLPAGSDKPSEFGSCMSDSTDSTGDGSGKESEYEGGFKTMNERKRNKKKKRKFKLTPGKEEFIKKANLV